MKTLISILFVSINLACFAQNSKPGVSPVAFPTITINLGGNNGGNIHADSLSRLVDSALVARDEKGNRFTITRFRCIYKFKSYYEDSQTGELKATDDMRVNEFRETSMMSELWRQSIQDNIQPGDEMTLDNIIVRLNDGKKIMAAPIRFTVSK